MRAIYAQGHTIGLASDGTGDVTEQLTAANEAMDEALFFKTVLALAPQGAYADEGWRLVADTGVPDEAVWRNSPALPCWSAAATPPPCWSASAMPRHRSCRF